MAVPDSVWGPAGTWQDLKPTAAGSETLRKTSKGLHNKKEKHLGLQSSWQAGEIQDETQE